SWAPGQSYNLSQGPPAQYTGNDGGCTYIPTLPSWQTQTVICPAYPAPTSLPLPVGGSQTVAIQLKWVALGPVAVGASVAASTPASDPDPNNNSAGLSFLVTPSGTAPGGGGGGSPP